MGQVPSDCADETRAGACTAQTRSVAAIEAELAESGRARSVVMARTLDLVSELDAAEGHPSAYPDVASWLCWNLGLSGRQARRWVRLAHTLAELPAIRAALSVGRVSVEQVEELVAVATPDNQEALVELATAAGSIDELHDRLVDLRDARQEREAEEREDPVRLRTWWTDDRFHLRGHITGADGVVVDHALQRLAALSPQDPNTGLYRDPQVRDGEALVQMASEALAADGDHDRATIVVHLSAADIVGPHGTSALEGQNRATRLFSRDELERLACDSRIQAAIDDPDGITIGIGRVSRKIPAWLRRAMDQRDRGCRFPGCGRTRWLHGHHIVAWSQDGPTNLDNLISLCGFHHRLIHNQGWTLEGNPNHTVTFRDHWGQIHTPPQRDTRWDTHHLDLIEQAAERRHIALANGPP